jgi:hypothetical protein
MSRVSRSVLGLGAIAAAGWFGFESLGGILHYTTQGDMCRGVLQRVENQQAVFGYAPLSTCWERHAGVYRAFTLELGVALVAVVAGVRWFISAFRARTSRK